MTKQIGKVYNNNRTYILYSGPGISKETFSGVVVKQEDETSFHQVGTYSTSWTENVFNETDESVVIDNKSWRERIEIGQSPQ